MTIRLLQNSALNKNLNDGLKNTYNFLGRPGHYNSVHIMSISWASRVHFLYV